MRKVIFTLVFTLFCGCSQVQPMSIPSFDVPVSSKPKVEQVIRTALTNRSWAITSVRPGRIEASYRKVGGATARIAVEYAGSRITVRHLDSTGLDYSEYGPSIHRTYNNWMANLEREILVVAGGML